MMDFSFERWLKQLLTEVFEDVFDNNPQPPPDDNDPAPTPPPDDDDDNNPPPDPETDAEAVLRIVNRERTQRGLGKLKLDTSLTEYAEEWSGVMQDQGRLFHSNLTFEGTARAENIARGYQTPEAVMRAWMNSDGHRHNILGPEYKGMGLGRVDDWWTQVFSNLQGTWDPDPQPEPTPNPDPEPTNYPWQNGRSLVFQDDFSNPGDTADKWIFNSTWSYPGAGPTNHPNGKLDHFSDAAITQSGGILTFTATPRSDGDWDTGLITTGDAEEPATFALKTGDFHVAHVQLPDDNNMGAWPALWTWNNGGNEIDSFEWHTDNPHLLELTNHVNGGGHYYVNDELVAPSKWVWIGTDFQAGNCTYYVGDSLDTLRAVYSDGTGVGNWEAYAIINLSIVDGTWHPAPTNDNPIVFRVSDYRVYR